MSVLRVYDIVKIEGKNTLNKKNSLEYFTIPYKNKHIIYFPLKGVVALVNKRFIDRIKTEDTFVKEMFNFAKKQPTLKIDYIDLKNSITLELTTACNLKCIYCFANGGDNPKYMNWKTAKAGLDYQIGRCEDKKFLLEFHGGGEPLLAFPMMKKCYEYAKKKCNKRGIKLKVSCATNGTLVTEEIAKWMKKVNMNVLLSFDGTPEIQNKQRPFRDGNPSNNLIEKTIELLNKYNVDYRTHSTITKDSLKMMNKIIKNLHALEVKRCGFQYLMRWGRCSDDKKIDSSYKNYELAIKKIITLAKKYNIKIVNDISKSKKIYAPNNTACAGCGYEFVVTAHKNITSCLAVTNPSDPATKIFFYGKIKDGKVIIDKNKLNYLRKRTVENMPQCKNCFAKYYCAGGCLVESVKNAKSAFKQTNRECVGKKIETVKNIINILK